MLSVTKKFEFAYAHFLPDYNGKCKNMHGHNAILEVEIGENTYSLDKIRAKYSGMVIDFGDLKDIVNDNVISVLDHKCLNDIMGRPTAENTAIWIWAVLYKIFKEALLRVRVYETSDSYAEKRKV